MENEIIPLIVGLGVLFAIKFGLKFLYVFIVNLMNKKKSNEQ